MRESFDARGTEWVESLGQDVRYAVRMLRKSPGFTAVAVLTLALGIGANTAIFSLIERVLLRALPYPAPNELVEISNTYPPLIPTGALSPGDFADFRAKAKSFSEMAAYVDVGQGFNIADKSDPGRVQVAYATSDLFPMLGVRPAIGTGFTAEQDKPGAAKVVMLSYSLWSSRYHQDPAVVGRAIELDSEAFTVAGVLPADFRGLSDADMWMPVGQYGDDLTGRIHHPYKTIARLKRGASLTQAQSEISTLHEQIAHAFPDTHKNWGITVAAMKNPLAAPMRNALLILFGSVGLVLLIACANIVNLLMARNAGRQKEIALRAALGATRVRLARQMLTESMLLALAGGAAGVFLAVISLAAAVRWIPAEYAGLADASINASVLGFTGAVCVAVGLLCGVGPALVTMKADPQHALSDAGRAASSGGGTTNVRNFLVVSEIALALIALVGAGLLMRSLHRLLETQLGFENEHVLAMQVDKAKLTNEQYAVMTDADAVKLGQSDSREAERITARLENIPGVVAAGSVDWLPLANKLQSASRFVIEGQEAAFAGGARPMAQTRVVSLGYFRALEIPLVRGRTFTESDWALQNVVVNQTMARKYWPGGDAVGKRVNICSLNPQPCWFSVIGVVGDVRQFGLDAPATSDLYFAGGWTPQIVIRTAGEPTAVASEAVRAIHEIDSTLPVTKVRTLDGVLAESVSPRRFSALLIEVFAALALGLAALGIYGVMNYVVGQRTREFGVRMAMGAGTRDIWNLVLGRGAKLAAAGVALGLVGAFMLTPLLSSMLYEVRATDPVTFAAVSVLLACVALAACYLPARRAMRVDPMVALRHE